jgi:lysozyme family protein
LSKVAQSVDVDGIIGKRTIQAFNEIVEKDLFLESFSCRIIRFYNAIVDRKKSQSVFLYGWVRRALF